MVTNPAAGVPTDDSAAVDATLFWADTATTAIVAPAPAGPERVAVPVHSVADLAATYGDIAGSPLALAVGDFLANGGQMALAMRSDDGPAAWAALEEAPAFQLLVADPALLAGDGFAAAHALCERRRAVLVADALPDGTMPPGLGANAAVYHPHLVDAEGVSHPAAAAVAGVYARMDGSRGVWKAPAGMSAQVLGAADVAHRLSERELATLNAAHVNGLRVMPDGSVVVWGARTASADPDWKYVAVRRLILFLEESLQQGLRWAVSEPNGEESWQRVCSEINEYLTRLWREGAFPAAQPEDAFFVRCDSSTMTAEEVEAGQLVCIVGIAPIRTSEFVTVRLALTTAGPAGSRPPA